MSTLDQHSYILPSLKRGLLILMACFAFRSTAWAQGTIFPGPTQTLAINFVALSNAPDYDLPSGGATYSVYSNIIASGSLFSANITAIVPTNADPFSVPLDTTFLQNDNNGSLTPIAFSGGNPAFNPALIQIGSPSSSTFYTSDVLLSPDQAQALLAGQFFVEVNFSYGSYLGQLSPIPEPPGMALLCSIGGLLAFFAPSKGPSESRRQGH